MVAGFALLVLAALLLDAGFTGRSLAQTIRGEIGRGFAFADLNVPDIGFQQAVQQSADTTTAALTGSGANRSKLYEVFHDPLGYYWDSGAIHQGGIGNHSDHVHVAGPYNYLLQLASVAKNRFHLRVGEFPRSQADCSGGTHVQGSFHCRGKGEAFDASGSAADMLAFAKWLIGGSGSGKRAKRQTVLA